MGSHLQRIGPRYDVNFATCLQSIEPHRERLGHGAFLRQMKVFLARVRQQMNTKFELFRVQININLSQETFPFPGGKEYAMLVPIRLLHSTFGIRGLICSRRLKLISSRFQLFSFPADALRQKSADVCEWGPVYTLRRGWNSVTMLLTLPHRIFPDVGQRVAIVALLIR